MRRSAAVMAAAVAHILGALLFAGLGLVLFLASQLQKNNPMFPEGMSQASIIVGCILLALAIWSAVTATGLLNLLEWGRIGAIVNGVMLALIFAISTIVLLTMPIPVTGNVDFNTLSVVRTALGFLYGLTALCGAAWAILLSRHSARAQFRGVPLNIDGTAAKPAMPLPALIIGVFLLIGAAGSLLAALAGIPFTLFILVVRGTPGMITHLVFGSLGAFLGWGLLRKKAWAPLAATSYLGFYALSTLTFFEAPGFMERLTLLFSAMPVQIRQAPSAYVVQQNTVAVISTLIFLLLPIPFLLKLHRDPSWGAHPNVT